MVAAARTLVAIALLGHIAFGVSRPHRAAAPVPIGQVILVKRVGVRAYEEAIEEFTERCRVHVSIMTAAEANERTEAKEAKLIVTVGQGAFDALKDHAGTVIPIYAFDGAPNHVSPQVDPELPLAMLRRAYPRAKTIAVISGPRSIAARDAFARAAERAQWRIVDLHEATGAQAVHELSLLGDRADAIVLLPDFDVITPQLFQLALRIQLERKIPIVASTRQQVLSGALFAYDFAPRALGRFAANRVNALLANQAVAPRESLEPELHYNATAAARLGLPPTALRSGKGPR
jgi:ABC-type uncharacterized transport system substrate-binding protein